MVEIDHLTYRFADGTLALDDICLSIPEGELVLIAGPNGSGKTTLLRHLNGLLLPQSGCVRLDGIPVGEDLRRARQMVGMVFQDPDSQIIGETVYDDVAFGPQNLRMDPAQVRCNVKRALRDVGLQDAGSRRPHALSGGEKRRLAVAGILAMGPRVLAFDEPFSSLDYDGVRQVLGQILSLHAAGYTILLVTHDLEKAIAHADRLILMNQGKIVRDGIPAQIVQDAEMYGVRRPCATRLGLEVHSWLR